MPDISTRKRITLIVLASLCFYSCKPATTNNSGDKGSQPPPKSEIKLRSSAFQDGGMIPSKYTCDGANISPPLEWSGIPQGAKSLALVCDDPDAPGKTWVHWVAFDLPSSRNSLPENVPPVEEIPGGGKPGTNDFKKIGYGGPCPPSGTHRYFFKLYALDKALELGNNTTKDQLLKAMAGHVLGQAEIIGRYKR
jgi:Raf kinase inhibitor-like YbhB/YbcL family protein